MARLIRKITFKRGSIVFVYMAGQHLPSGRTIGSIIEFTEGSTYGVEIYMQNDQNEIALWRRIMNCELDIEFDCEEILRD